MIPGMHLALQGGLARSFARSAQLMNLPAHPQPLRIGNQDDCFPSQVRTPLIPSFVWTSLTRR